jgi:hypothetical protein
MEPTITTRLRMRTEPATAPLTKEKEMEFFEERPKFDLEIDKDGKVLSLKHTYKPKPSDDDARSVVQFPQALE